ncbi:MAG: AMP-dependent synthetase/ligase [Propioniciclava sp.]
MDGAHIAVRLERAFRDHAARPATRILAGDDWDQMTYAELAASVHSLARHLIDHGVSEGDRVAVFSANRPEWSVADLALLSIRAVVVPLYPTSTPDQVRHILADAGVVHAFVETEDLLGRLEQVWPALAELHEAWTFDRVDRDDGRIRPVVDVLAGQPSPEADQEAVRRLKRASGDDIASLIYTSGTTGEPRGAVLTHRGFTFELDALDAFFTITPQDSSLCFLPLSHALERAWTFKVLMSGSLNTYVPDPTTVADLLVLARPTMIVSVPRLYEKVYATVTAAVASSPARQRIFAWAMRVGAACQRSHLRGERPSGWLTGQLRLADRLVFRSIREALGGPKTVMACGGAPLRREIEEFFSAAGMLLCQGYGLTEASPLITFNAPAAFRFGSCGRVVDGGELRIGEDGEVLYRGPNVMREYWGKPEATAAALDKDGWLHTGDVGHVDVEGYLHITDRIKDIIVTSGGKNIAPAPIEGMILADPLFEHAVLLGDNRPYVTLLVRPSFPALEDLAHHLRVQVPDPRDLLGVDAVVDEVRRRVAALTATLPRQEQVKDLRLLADDFTLENGLLTPTMKVRRRQVEQRFSHLIEEMYAKVSAGRKKTGI